VRTPGEPGNLADLPGLTVGGLSEQEAQTVLDDAAGSGIDERVGMQLIHETGANPLALREIAGALTTQQLSGEASLPDPLPIGGRRQDVFLTRLHALAPAAQTLVLLAAADTSGDAVVLRRAAEELGLGFEDATVREVERLVSVDHEIRFAHPLIRAAVYQGAS